MVSRALNSLGGSERVSGMVLSVNKTDEWSELRSRRLTAEECRQEGIFVTKISSMSGFFRGEEGQ